MKPIHFTFIFILCIFSLILAGCNSAASTTDTEVMPPTEAVIVEPAVDLKPTEEIIPTEIPLPTETPEPIACTIAFESNRDGNWEIYHMGPDGKNLRNLTNHPADDMQPALSGDGKHIAFISNRETEECAGQSLYVMSVDGTDPKRLSKCIGANSPDWSSDSEWITFSGDRDIFIVPADGSADPVNLTNSPEEDGFPVISPDNQKIAFLSGGTQNWNVFIMDLDGSQPQQLTSEGGEIGIDWSEDGRIVVGGWDRGDQGCCNFVMNPDGSDIMEAGGKGEMQKYLPFWTWDGNRVECFSVNLDGNNEEVYLLGEMFPDIFFNLTNHPADDRNPTWPALCGPGVLIQQSNPDQEQDEELDQQSSADSGEIVLGYAGDNPWQSQRKDNFYRACQELGVKCVQGEMDELINQRVSAIVLNSRNDVIKGSHPSILTARDKGIPVIVLDAENITDGAYYITIDHDKWAAKSLEWMFDSIGGKGDFAFFNFQTYNNHKAVIEAMLTKYPGIKLVEARFDDYTHDHTVMEADVRAFMKRYPNLKAIWTDEEFDNVIWGVKDVVSADNWPLVLCGATKRGLQVWETVKADNPGFNCIALSNPPGIAYDAAYTAFYLASGLEINPLSLRGEFGKTLYVDIPIVTQEDLAKWIEAFAGQDDHHSVDQFMTPEEIQEKWFLKE